MSDTNSKWGLSVGQRVELAPHLDWWMKGARYGQVVSFGTTRLHVKLDKGQLVRLSPTDVNPI